MRTFALVLPLALAACGKARDGERPGAKPAAPAGSAGRPARPASAAGKATDRVAPVVHVAAGTSAGDLELSASVEGCTLHLDYFAAWRSARLRAVGLAPGAPCAAPLEPRLLRLREMIGVLQGKVGKRPPFRSFGFYGRLADYEPMARRIALAVARSPGWDARAGTPRGGPGGEAIGAFVTRLADEHGAYAEVVDLFDALGYTAHLAGVEKVAVAKAATLPYADWLAAQGVDRGALVPSDFIFGFRIALPVTGGMRKAGAAAGPTRRAVE